MSYFSIDTITSLASIPSGGSIHLIGVSGIAMAQLAVALQQAGYNVSGSDIEFWEPSGSLLKGSSVKTYTGYDSKHIASNIDLVVIGNAIRADNPEVKAVEEKKLNYTCFPKLLHEVVIKGKTSIVISGTHGKSTTSALTAWCLKESDSNPGFFIGGSVRGIPSSLVAGSGSVSVVEGDEYDSAFFAKVPKFDFYSPNILLVTSVEFDHADIYPSLDAINKEFTDLVYSMNAEGFVVVSDQGENIKKLTAEWKKNSRAKIFTYGVDASADIRILSRDNSEQGQTISFSAFGSEHSLRTRLFGEYNAYNAVGSWACMTLAGIKNLKGFDSFPGVKRRQEIRFQDDKNVLIEDFAHHPTAVKQTLKGIKEQFPKRKIVACFEPRSNTSRRKVFQAAYAEAFQESDAIFLKEVSARHNDTPENLFSCTELSHELMLHGKISEVFSDAKQFVAAVKAITDPKVVVVMSNGSFDGLIEILNASIS